MNTGNYTTVLATKKIQPLLTQSFGEKGSLKATSNRSFKHHSRHRKMDPDCERKPQKQALSHTFIGRSREINNIKEFFLNFMLDTSGNALQMIHITGSPTIGKTQLATEMLRVMDIECMESGLSLKSHFIDLQKEARMSNVLKQIASEFKCPFLHCTGRKLIRELLSRRNQSTCELLVLDGVDDLLSYEKSNGEFLEFCEEFLSETSKSNGFRVFLLLTSTIKFQFPRSETKLFTIIALLPLTLDESKEGLLSISKQKDYGDYLDDLATYSVGYPIAILLIGAIVKVGHIIPKELVDRLSRDWVATLVNGDGQKTISRVRSVINVCLDSLPIRLRKDYVKLAYIPASFTLETARYITSTRVTPSTAVVKHDLLLPLYDRSLVEIYHLLDPLSKMKRFHIHQFLRSFVEDKYHLLDCDLNEVRNRYCVFYGQLLLKISPLLERDCATHLPVFTIEIRNIEKLLREAIHCIGDNTELFLHVAYESNVFIETFLPTEEAVEFYKACVNAAQNKERPGGINKLSEARMLLVYGKMLGAAKTDFELEYEQYMKAMRLLRPRGDTLEMATLLNSIAGNLHSRGKRLEAIEELYETRAVLDRLGDRISKSLIPGPLMVEGEQHRSVPLEPQMRLSIQRIRASATYMLGVIYAWIGKTSEAENYHLESLKLKRQLWGENHPYIGVGYNGLSLVYEKTGEPEKAAQFCFLGLDIKQKFFKEPNVGVIVSLNNAARHLSQQKGEHQRALELLDKAYKMRENLGLNHRDTSLIFNNQGKVYSWMGDWKNAMINFEKSVQLRQQYIGNHASTASSMHLLGKSYLNAGHPKHAVNSLTACLQMREDVHMKEQPLSEERADTLEPLAEAYCAVGNKEKAKEFYSRTVIELKRLSCEFGDRGEKGKQAKFERMIDVVQQKLESVRKDTAQDTRKHGLYFDIGKHLFDICGYLGVICVVGVTCLMMLWFCCKYDVMYLFT